MSKSKRLLSFLYPFLVLVGLIGAARAEEFPVRELKVTSVSGVVPGVSCSESNRSTTVKIDFLPAIPRPKTHRSRSL